VSRIDQIIADALAGSPETHVAMLAREVVRLRDAPAVVVPEIMLSDISNECGAMLCDDREAFRRGALWAQKFITSRARAIPADRELGEGMVAISGSLATLLQELVFAVNAFLAESSPWIGPGAPAEVPALTEIASRRLQYMLDQIRANQGGADHD
jgi:hypothetical protein